MDTEEILRKKNLKVRHYTITAGILVISTLEEETLKWMNILPSEGRLFINSPAITNQNPPRQVRYCYRTVVHRDERNFDVQAFAGAVKTFSFILEFHLDDALGIIFLVDQRRPEFNEASKELLLLLQSYQLKVIIAVVDIDPASNPELMRNQLEVLDKELLLTCNIEDPKSVKESMMTVVRLIPEFTANKGLMDELNQL